MGAAMIIATGWAVVDKRKINIKTVSDTRRAAIVNWLVVEGDILVFATMSDFTIEELWAESRGTAICTTVTITQNEGN